MFVSESKRTTKTDGLAGIDGIKHSKIVANNTFEYVTNNGDIHYRLHNTDVVVFKSNGDIVLDSGGWLTVTTKERINRYLPSGYSLYQEKGIWIVCGEDWEVPFEDGMVLPADGSKPEVSHDINHDKLRIKQINKYARECQRLADSKELKPNNDGDCFLCQFELSGNDMGTDHLISHLEEGYIVGSLVVSAFLWAGFSRTQLPIVYGGCNTANVVRRYLKFRLGLPY